MNQTEQIAVKVHPASPAGKLPQRTHDGDLAYDFFVPENGFKVTKRVKHTHNYAHPVILNISSGDDVILIKEGAKDCEVNEWDEILVGEGESIAITPSLSQS
jgi:hypothetical protein